VPVETDLSTGVVVALIISCALDLSLTFWHDDKIMAARQTKHIKAVILFIVIVLIIIHF
jgi:hypothetical protein